MSLRRRASRVQSEPAARAASRSKFELIEEDQRAKQKGYAASLSYSALSSLARSCPESALCRVGSVFRSRRKKVQITGEDPTYTVLYLGNTTTIQSKGEGCTDAAVSKIWSRSDMAKSGTKMKLTVSAQGVRMVHADDKTRRPGHLYLLHRITYCVADPRLPRVFAWIYRHEMKHKAVTLRCHAVLASKPEKAKAMALLLYQTSAAALAEFKRLKRREDARHQQQQLVGEQTVPVAPLRKLLLLNAQCCYKPPVERSRSAPKLGSITEDLLGEEQEEKATHFEYEDVLDSSGSAVESEDNGRALTRLISDLGEMSIGNDVGALRSDLGVTRLLSGESTSSESSADGATEASNDGPGQDIG
ncbi:protein FAM43A [Arapaima gigas]